MALVVKNPPANGKCQRHGFDPWVGKIPCRRDSNPLQYSCLENSMDRGACRTTVHGVAKSWTALKWLGMHGAHMHEQCRDWGHWTSPIQVKNPCKPCITLQSTLRICGSIAEDSSNHPSCSTIVHIYWKKSTCRWTHGVQTYIVQGSTVYHFKMIFKIPWYQNINRCNTHLALWILFCVSFGQDKAKLQRKKIKRKNPRPWTLLPFFSVMK